MSRFVDETPIRVKAGNGGAGCISFLHEKFLEFGGPDGGDGGDGGDVYFVADPRVMALGHIRPERLYKAENGQPGMGNKCSGRRGQDLIIKVPFGTELIDPESGEVIHDFIDEEPFCAAKGGRGGKGNAFFANSVRQSPKFAQPGEETEERQFRLALKMIADVGLVGFPNAGKSTLLKSLTHANPKIAGYPFTTLTPNLGVMEHEAGQITVADIPGILEGASRGYGLGLSFLKHIERVKLLVFVLDIATAHGTDELKILKSELSSYNKKLLQRPSLVVFNKADLVDDRQFLTDYIASFKAEGIDCLTVSAMTGEGLDLLKAEILRRLQEKAAIKRSIKFTATDST